MHADSSDDIDDDDYLFQALTMAIPRSTMAIPHITMANPQTALTLPSYYRIISRFGGCFGVVLPLPDLAK